jgi:hypothetical protein
LRVSERLQRTDILHGVEGVIGSTQRAATGLSGRQEHGMTDAYQAVGTTLGGSTLVGDKMTTFDIATLAIDRLRLRACQASDLDSYASMQANPEVMAQQRDCNGS